MSYTRLWEVRMRPQGSPAELERRRLRAIELLQREIPVHVVAERLGVDRRSVRRWKRAYRGRCRNGLRAARETVLAALERHGPVAAWIVDDTGMPKKGRHSVGV